jgi:heat shock protein HslJ
MTRRQRLFVTVLASLALLAAGCGDDDDGSSDVSADDLDGRTFVADEVTGHTVVEGTEITLTFADEAIVAAAGCNTMRAGYEIDDGVLTLDGPMAQTLMACPEELEAQDEWVAAFLGDSPTVALADDVLTLTAGDASISATELT